MNRTLDKNKFCMLIPVLLIFVNDPLVFLKVCVKSTMTNMSIDEV